MGYVYSSPQTVKSPYGNVNMEICVYRGVITRTETSVSFNFGVRFKPTTSWTTNSLVAKYSTDTYFATKSGGSTKAEVGKYYYTGSSNPSDGYKNTTESAPVFSYSNSNINKDTISVSFYVGLGWKDYSGSQGGTLLVSLPIDRYVSNPGAPTVTVTDNNNNTFKFTVTPGSNGVNNNADGVSDTQYNIDGGTTWINCAVVKSGNNYVSNNVSISGGNKSVRCRAKTKGTITGTASDYGYSSVTEVLYYTAPSIPANLDITSNKSKFTPKATYTFSWSASTGGTNNPVKDYTYEIYKNNNKLTGASGTTTATSITKTPSDLGALIKGDIIKFRVKANGTNDEFSSNFSGYKQVTVVSSGVMYVRVGDTWKEGQVYIRDSNDVWHEASGVYVRDNNNDWKESS